jgi:hypothetical protein
MIYHNGDHRMTLVLRIAAIAVAFLIGAATVASANTQELTLTVPLKITAPDKASAAATPQGGIKPFDVNCAIGSGLGYSTGASAVQGQVVGQGSTATSGSKTVLGPDGKVLPNASATVIITYDDGLNAGSVGAGVAPKNVSNYLCFVQWQTPIPSLAPIFVQGTLQATVKS